MKNDFGSIIELLYNNKVIDCVKYNDYYLQLQDADYLERVNQHLAVLDRVCISTSDGHGFLMSILDHSTKEAQKIALDNLAYCRDKLFPFVSWLQWIEVISKQGNILKATTSLELVQVHDKLKDNTQFCAALEEIAEGLGITASASTPTARFQQILDWFEKNEYLLKQEGANLAYVATAKWSAHEEYMECLVRYNSVPRAQEVVQESLI